MKTRFINTVIYAVVFSLVLLPSAALAERAKKAPLYDEVPLCSLSRELGLSAEQKELFTEQRYQTKLKKIQLRNKVQMKQLELRHELEKKEINRETVNKIIEELKEMHGALLTQKVDSIIKTKEILTPEQIEKLESFVRQEQHKGMGQRMQDKFRNWMGK